MARVRLFEIVLLVSSKKVPVGEIVRLETHGSFQPLLCVTFGVRSRNCSSNRKKREPQPD